GLANPVLPVTLSPCQLAHCSLRYYPEQGPSFPHRPAAVDRSGPRWNTGGEQTDRTPMSSMGERGPLPLAAGSGSEARLVPFRRPVGMHGLTTDLLSRACRTFLHLAYPEGERMIPPARLPFFHMRPDQPLSTFLEMPAVCERLVTTDGQP